MAGALRSTLSFQQAFSYKMPNLDRVVTIPTDHTTSFVLGAYAHSSICPTSHSPFFGQAIFLATVFITLQRLCISLFVA